MNIKMIGADVIGVSLQHGFEDGDDFFGVRRGFAVGAVEMPGTEAHHGIGVERGGVEIVGVFGDELFHRGAIIVGEFREGWVGIAGVSAGQVSQLCAALDEKVRRFREGPLGEIRYVWVDALYEKMRVDDRVESMR